MSSYPELLLTFNEKKASSSSFTVRIPGSKVRFVSLRKLLKLYGVSEILEASLGPAFVTKWLKACAISFLSWIF